MKFLPSHDIGANYGAEGNYGVGRSFHRPHPRIQTLISAMLLVLAILYLLPGYLNANAASGSDTIVSRQTNLLAPSFPHACVCLNAQNRSRWDIVWGCLVTIFACSWVSVHPNIPRPHDHWWRKAMRRLELMFWSIIAPELIIYWALCQWLGARYLAEKYHHRFKWTETHGYFVQMGGFVLYDGEKFMGVICPEKLEDLLNKNRIAMPTITEEEIEDRSKGDGLSKALVVVQTTWFIAQCIARKLQGLVITELELATLAIAALNVVMYIFWRNKPLDVATTVPVYLLQPSGPVPPTSVEPLGRETVANEISNPQDTPEAEENEQKNLQAVVIDIESLSPSTKMWQKNNINFVALARQVWWFISGILYRWIGNGVIAVVARMGEIRFTDTISEGDDNPKAFYAYNPTPHKVNAGKDIVLLFVGMLLGAIHCVGWNFFFPSLIEANVWRISSALITGIPAVGLVSILFLGLDEDFHDDSGSNVICYLMGLAVPVYVLARLALGVVALSSLRDLPSGALGTVEWTSFIPHV